MDTKRFLSSLWEELSKEYPFEKIFSPYYYLHVFQITGLFYISFMSLVRVPGSFNPLQSAAIYFLILLIFAVSTKFIDWSEIDFDHLFNKRFYIFTGTISWGLRISFTYNKTMAKIVFLDFFGGDEFVIVFLDFMKFIALVVLIKLFISGDKVPWKSIKKNSEEVND